MEVKQCFRCSKEQPLDQYNKKSAEKDGLNRYCKSCMNVETREYYKRTKEKRSGYYKQHRIKNKEYFNAYSKNHYHTNKELYREWNNNKYATDINFKLKHIVSSRIHSGLKLYKTLKQDRTIEYLGCSIEDYYIYLQRKFDKNMSWDNHGVYWEIDHIKPVDAFNLSDESQLYECFHYTNTQPLNKIENRLKSNNQ